MTLFPFYKNMLRFSGCSCSDKNGALLAKFQPGVLNSFVLVCRCILYHNRITLASRLSFCQVCLSVSFIASFTQGRSQGGPGVPVTPPYCKPFLTKQPKTGGENAMTFQLENGQTNEYPHFDTV